MNKHTPGPWFIDYEGGGSMGRRAMLENKDGECVGYLYEAEFEDERLIAAAPELLDALLTLMENAENVDGLGFNMFAVTKARRAISKATGENK
jgi:hypothetical protein